MEKFFRPLDYLERSRLGKRLSSPLVTPGPILRPLLPDVREIESDPGHWLRISRDEALRALDLASVAMVYPSAGYRAVAWMAAGLAIASGRFHALHAPAYYRYSGGTLPTRPKAGIRRKAEAEEFEPLEPLLPEPEFWTEIAMVDEEGAPLDGVRYQAELPDGTIRRGRLDSAGCARIGSPVNGTFQASFPELIGTMRGEGGQWPVGVFTALCN